MANPTETLARKPLPSIVPRRTAARATPRTTKNSITAGTNESIKATSSSQTASTTAGLHAPLRGVKYALEGSPLVRKVLYGISPIGLGHVTRSLVVYEHLRR